MGHVFVITQEASPGFFTYLVEFESSRLKAQESPSYIGSRISEEGTKIKSFASVFPHHRDGGAVSTWARAISGQGSLPGRGRFRAGLRRVCNVPSIQYY